MQGFAKIIVITYPNTAFYGKFKNMYTNVYLRIESQVQVLLTFADNGRGGSKIDKIMLT